MAEEAHLSVQAQSAGQPLGGASIGGLAAAGELQHRPQAALAQHGERADQRLRILLAGEAGRHHDAGFATAGRMGVRGGEALEADAVRDGDGLLFRHAQFNEASTHAFRHPDQARAHGAETARLRASAGGVALARVVLDLHQGRHAGQAPGTAAEQVFGEAVRHHDVGPQAFAQSTQGPDGDQMGPARHEVDGQPLVAQGLDAVELGGVLGALLATQHEDGFDALAVQLCQAQVDGYLRGAREAAGDEVQHAAARRRCRRARGGREHRGSVSAHVRLPTRKSHSHSTTDNVMSPVAGGGVAGTTCAGARRRSRCPLERIPSVRRRLSGEGHRLRRRAGQSSVQRCPATPPGGAVLGPE